MVSKAQDLEDTLVNYLHEAREITSANKALWDIDLYGPILLVDPTTRVVYANEPDTDGTLKQNKQLYNGALPKSINISNTALTWSGKRWTMVMLPLPQGKHERLNLITHELFHRAQPLLNFNLNNPDNNHLDKKNGRIYLRLELEALRSAILSTSNKLRNIHITHALAFRRARYQLYPMADSTENSLELNEGITEYTGLMMSGRNDSQVLKHLNESLLRFLASKTYVRSFAYQTIPVYGYLLQKNKPYWNKDISANTNLTNYFQSSFNISIRSLENIANLSKDYNGELIVQEETKREEANNQLIKSYIEKFVTHAHFELPFEKMKVSFEYENIIPLEEYGTIYPTMRITDSWGILTIQNGALMSPNWNKITLTVPTEINPGEIKGDGWHLELRADIYTIRKDIYSANYYLTKK